MNNEKYYLNPGIGETSYVYSDYHSLIGINNSKFDNIGPNGVNLTISVLSLNRSSLTLKLMESINENLPEFEGEFLVIDNGSDKDELNIIKEYTKKVSYKCRIVELEKNYGVGGGRNQTMKYVNTDWVMYLDNDIYFVGNPLKKIQKDISLLGCHFLNMPLMDETGNKIFAYGGHLYLHKETEEIHVGGGSVCAQISCTPNEESEGFLATFLFGGASVINRHTFLQCGGFDEGMFIGFEDTDFSLNLFRRGYKIGNCGMLCLVHNHQKPTKKTDADYEKERFSRNILKKSADYFEKKHGFHVWNNFVDNWLVERKKELGLSEEDCSSENSNNQVPAKVLPKVALILDTDNWAFANIATQIKKNLSEDFEFKIIPMSIVDNISRVLLMVRDFDLVHFFWRTHVALVGSEENKRYIEDLKIEFDTFYDKIIKDMNISTCVYDHLFLDSGSNDYNNQVFNKAANYYVSSKKLHEIYSELPFCKKPVDILEDGVDTSLFRPINIERLKNAGNRKLVIGWSGNSKWADYIEDFKGVHTILKPAIEQLQNEGYPIETLFADRAERMIPHHEMPEYYSKIDVYICTSKIEGTPNPVLESMACGVPVITTDVGIVPQVFGEKQKEFILEERSIECLKEAIKKLIDGPQTLVELSDENLRQIVDWDWSIKAKKFKGYFNKCLGTNKAD